MSTFEIRTKAYAKKNQAFELKAREGFLHSIETLETSLGRAHKTYKKGLIPSSRMEEYKKNRRDGLTMIISDKASIEVIENAIRFNVSIRKQDRKNAYKYAKKCSESECAFLDLLMKGNSMVGNELQLSSSTNDDDEFKTKKHKGDDEISRQYGKTMLENEKTRKTILEECELHNYWS
tara:strand:+ start:1483 stop:2016 length:534 start_codon:yes stop_codon:yes gene_type:complete